MYDKGIHNNCTELNLDIGVMYNAALLYAVDKVNKENILYGNKLVCRAMDMCKKGMIRSPYITVTNDGFAVIGPYSSETAEFTSQFLSLFRISTVSYGASSVALSNRDIYSRFFRTIPSDVHTVRIFSELARKYSWIYVAVIYTDNEDGRSMLTEFERQLSRDFCVRISVHVKDQDPLNR